MLAMCCYCLRACIVNPIIVTIEVLNYNWCMFYLTQCITITTRLVIIFGFDFACNSNETER